VQRSKVSARVNPTDAFRSTHYIRHNQRRQEHLASLGLPLANRSVLELGAGIGDHSSFFLDRGCSLIITEPREENLEVLRVRYPDHDVRHLSLDEPPAEPIRASIVYCYGTLYHVERPALAIEWMGRCASDMLLLETCVAAGSEETVYPFEESPEAVDNAVRGHGCRPTRGWLRRELRRAFPYVYVPRTQPAHEEFPLDWTDPALRGRTLIRAVFVASHAPVRNALLTEDLLSLQYVS
jgi:hypothetical protein